MSRREGDHPGANWAERRRKIKKRRRAGKRRGSQKREVKGYLARPEDREK